MATMQFEYDPERLIEEIKKRPGIWDFQNEEYRNKIVRFKLWNEVVTELMQPNMKVSKSEMRELEIQLQKKWKGIRDCYQKFITKPRTRRPYIYSKHLKFLMKNLEIPANKEDGGDNSSGSDEALRPRKRWTARKTLKIVKDEEQSSEDENSYFVDTLDDTIEYSNDANETAQSVKALNQSQVDDFVFANADAPTKSDVDDPDKMFLMSLLPHLKTIPEENRLNVKMELMQVLRNANQSIL